MQATYSFPTASGHTIEARQTATGYDVHVRDADGVTISTVALTALHVQILLTQLQSRTAPTPKRPPARRKRPTSN